MKRLKIKRKHGHWVSKNRELIGSSKKDPGRNPNFDTEETKLLISLWGDPAFQKTLITTHRKHTVIVKLAEQMSEYGYTRTAGEINTRIKNLKCFYNRLKKDMELGPIDGSSWKHFDAMDEIMTRSIFSVRPDEIPKPSHKYQLEVIKAEQEEKRNRKAELTPFNEEKTNATHMTTHGNASDFSVVSPKHEISDDDDVQFVNSDGSVIMDYEQQNENVFEIETIVGDDMSLANSGLENGALLVPKKERVDDDDEVQLQNPEKKMTPESQTPTRLTEYIQLPNNNSKSIALPTTCLTTVNGNNCNTLIQAPQPSPVMTTMPQSIVFANQSKAISNAQGKISLVPTNFLLQQNNKPQPQQIQIRSHPQQPQQRIICAQPNGQSNPGIVQSGGPGRMKVLLVNAFQNGKTTSVAAPKEPSFPNSNLINTTNTNQNDGGVTITYSDTPKPPPRTEETPSTKDPGMEMLFNKLIVMQSENNEIQKQRLEIERQRLEFEKSIGSRLLEVLSSFRPVQTHDYTITSVSSKTNENFEEFARDKAPIPDIIDDFNTFHLLTPKVEKID